MSKPTRDTQLRSGEQRLQEWGIASDTGFDAFAEKISQYGIAQIKSHKLTAGA